MKFEEYLAIVIPKIGPNAAFDLGRDAQRKALENLLIDKRIISRLELEAETEKEFGNAAQNVSKMPAFPKEEENNKKNDQ